MKTVRCQRCLKEVPRDMSFRCSVCSKVLCNDEAAFVGGAICKICDIDNWTGRS